MIPRLNAELHQLQEQQKKLQQLRPKIDEVSSAQHSLPIQATSFLGFAS